MSQSDDSNGSESSNIDDSESDRENSEKIGNNQQVEIAIANNLKKAFESDNGLKNKLNNT